MQRFTIRAEDEGIHVGLMKRTFFVHSFDWKIRVGSLALIGRGIGGQGGGCKP